MLCQIQTKKNMAGSSSVNSQNSKPKANSSGFNEWTIDSVLYSALPPLIQSILVIRPIGYSLLPKSHNQKNPSIPGLIHTCLCKGSTKDQS